MYNYSINLLGNNIQIALFICYLFIIFLIYQDHYISYHYFYILQYIIHSLYFSYSNNNNNNNNNNSYSYSYIFS